MCKLYTFGHWIWSSLEDIMANLLSLVQAWEFPPPLCLFNFVYLLCFKFVNMIGKSTINDGGLVLIIVG